MNGRYSAETSGGGQTDPVDLATLRGWIAQGRIAPSTTLISEATGERVRADSLAELFADMIAREPRTSGLPASVLIIGIPVLAALAFALFFPLFSPSRGGIRTRGLSQMKQLGTGILIYAGDHDNHFPPAMTSARAFERGVLPLVKAPLLFKTANPRGGEILGDARLGGRLTTNVKDPAKTIMLFDSLPGTGGRAPIARVDGSARIVPHATISGLMTPDPFDGLILREERRRERAAAP